MKIAVITCYDQIDHMRPLVLRQAFKDCPGVETKIIKNKHKGLLRYLEVPARIIALRIKWRPDAYVITFRGYEMLPFVLMIKGRKPLVFDELVNAIAYLNEHNRLAKGSMLHKLFSAFYGWLLKRCRFILADTEAHAKLSSKLAKVDMSKYITIPIGTDESIFYPVKGGKKKKGFTVFYYGVMVKLHGIEYVLDAAVELCKKYPDINFVLGGDKGKAKAAYEAAIKKGARITYQPWFTYEEIVHNAHNSDLCVGGPFGNTPQSQFVITTKTFQYLAAETPVIVGRNKVNGALQDKKNSLVVPQGNRRAIIDAISWAYEHPKELKVIAKAGRRLYEQQFSKSVINGKIKEIVEKLR